MQTIKGDEARQLAKQLLDTYFKTAEYPFTSHHIDSYDQFLKNGLPNIIRERNPILILKELIPNRNLYKYRVEIFIGGEDGKGIYMGTPTVSLQDSDEVRLLFPNEARLRNLTYAADILADVVVKIYRTETNEAGILQTLEPDIIEMKKNGDLDERIPLCRMPILLHSRYCLLHDKPEAFLQEVGECKYDYGGYFIVEGAEKVLITRQEQAFNTLYISNQERDPKIKQYANITCLSPKTRMVKRVAFQLTRMAETIHVTVPFVRKPVPLFILFRAMGVQSDKDIMRLIFPDPDSAEAKMLSPLLLPSISEALPFTDTYSAVQYMKVLTKGFSEAHVLDVINNQLFIHVENNPGLRAAFLAECVRSILRVSAGIDQPTNRDDIRNQRCLTSGFLTQMLFQGIYTQWTKKVSLAIDEKYSYQKTIYEGKNFINIFLPGNRNGIFRVNMLTEGLMRGFKGKWGSGVGEEKTGVLQALSRLSYHDFLSHCRRVVLDFDTGMKLPGPRRLNPSQYGYFCTSETPTGASIGITKNLSMMALISIETEPSGLIQWLFTRGQVLQYENINEDVRKASVPVFLNGGILGYTQRPGLLRDVLKALKWSGCLPAFASVGFNIRDRRVFIYLDEGRPVRPLIHLGPGGTLPVEKLAAGKRWRDLIFGNLPLTAERNISLPGFVDPLAEKESPPLEEYLSFLEPHVGVIEYIDPYEQNEIYVANFPEYIVPTTSHLEIHPSTIVGLMTSMIPFANHNQSPRNQLSCSQSKQGLSVYSTNYPNRFDNQVHVLCYGEAPLCRTLYYDYVANGSIGYGHNLVLAIGSFTGYNQDDGIVMNADALARGMFRSMAYRSYEAYEEDDEKAETQTRIANPQQIAGWTSLRPGLDYSKLDVRGIIKEGSYVDQNTVIVGRYLRSKSGQYRDASVTPQVWTSGRVEKIAIMVSNKGLRLIKIRVVHDRIPELGDKFSNRHGQKGTIGMAIRGHDMPRTIDGVVPDMIMNPHAIPSRMTIAQLLETLFGKAAVRCGAIANGTSFMNDGDPSEAIGDVLEKEFGLERYGNEILYDGTTGVQIPSTIFIGQCYTMRLKHMTQDKWNARGEGRREQRTHQPTGGRGNEGGLRIGEMERDAIVGHGMSLFTRESMMKRGDGTKFTICNGCGTIPIYNEAEGFYVCSLCDGPVQYAGDNASNLELLPPNKRSLATFSTVEMPYVVKLLEQELSTYMNIGMRFLTNKNVQRLQPPDLSSISDEQLEEYAKIELPEFIYPEYHIPEVLPEVKTIEARPEDLKALGIPVQREEAVLEVDENEVLEASMPPMASLLVANIAPMPNVAPAPVAAAPMDGEPMVQVAPLAPVQQNVTYVPMVPAQQSSAPVFNASAQVLPPPIPGAPQTVVVDTSPQAMQASGFDTDMQPQLPRMQGGRGTRKVARFAGGGPSPAPMQQQQAQPQQQNNNVRVSVMKLGS